MPTFGEKQKQPQQKSSANLTPANAWAPAASHKAHPILHLQRTIGNQAVLRLLRARANRLEAGSDPEDGATTEVRSETPTAAPFAPDFSRIPVHAPAPITIQPKLTVGTPGDIYEQEADEISEKVMPMAEPQLQRACACGGGCAECQTKQPSQEHPHFPASAPAVVQRKKQDPKAGANPKPPKPASAKGPQQRLYIVRDKTLGLGGGVLVHDLGDFKQNVMRTKSETEWTLVLAIHGSEDRLGAQAPPDWQRDAVFYRPADIVRLFGDDRAFVTWRDRYGPTHLALVSCRVSASFEGTLIESLTHSRAGMPKQSRQGLGEGCKPLSTAITIEDAPPTRSAFDKLPAREQESIIKQLTELNNKWGYYGAPPVPDDKLVDYYYNEDPKGEWVEVEVGKDEGHGAANPTPTGIPFWNRTTGKDARRFRQLCDQGAGQLRERTPTVPP